MKPITILPFTEQELRLFIKSEIIEAVSAVLKSKHFETDEGKNDLIGQKEACRLLQVSAVTMWAWRKEGKINYKKIGRKVYYSKKEIQTMHQPSIGND